MTSGKQIINRFEDFAPLSLAWERDPSGLQLGNPDKPVKTVLVTLDVRPEVVTEAEAIHADMIFSHHPAMFRPVHNLDLRVPQNAMYAQILKDGLRVVARDLYRLVQKVAILGGDGGDAFNDAKQAGADVFITGDVYYHTGHDMLAADLPVIDPGHHIESIMKGKVATLINEWADAEGWDVKAIPSKLSTDPFTFM